MYTVVCTFRISLADHSIIIFSPSAEVGTFALSSYFRASGIGAAGRPWLPHFVAPLQKNINTFKPRYLRQFNFMIALDVLQSFLLVNILCIWEHVQNAYRCYESASWPLKGTRAKTYHIWSARTLHASAEIRSASGHRLRRCAAIMGVSTAAPLQRAGTGPGFSDPWV